MSFFKFEIIYKSKISNARVGKIYTKHGEINTPSFVAVGTNGVLKALDNILLNNIDLDLMFCNTYHLMLHPGTDTIKNSGGIHKFINRNKPIITDSGGFQVFSLAYKSVNNELKSKGSKHSKNSIIKIDENGVYFRSYRDGSLVLLTPEISVQEQKKIGADIIIPFDELNPYHIDYNDLKKSFYRTHRWQERSLNEHLKNISDQAMYGVIHGSIYDNLRKESCNILSNMQFDGLAIGGSLGKDRKEMVNMLKKLMNYIPYNKPNHLLGIGDIESIENIIPLGIDTFDSSHPTKCARHGLLFTSNGNIKIIQTKYKNIFEPIDKNCNCLTCINYTTSYIHHLFKANEISAYNLASLHNVTFMVNLLKSYRKKILNDEI